MPMSMPEGRSVVAPENVRDISEGYTLGEGGAPVANIPPPERRIAVGKLRITSDNEEKALSIIEQYSYNSDDELYEMNAESFALLLSSLNMEHVEYTDYTIASDGVVRFQVDFQ